MPKHRSRKRARANPKAQKTMKVAGKFNRASTVVENDESPVDVPLIQTGDPEFDILAMPSLRALVERTYDEMILPRQNDFGQMIQFKIEGDKSFINLNESELVVEYKYVDKDGNDYPNDVAADANIRRQYAESQILHSLWKSVEVRIHNEDVNSKVSTQYYRKAHLDNILSKNKEQQILLEETQHYEKDVIMDQAIPNDTKLNAIPAAILTSKKMRLLRANKKSGRFIVRGRPQHFLFEQRKRIIPHCQLEFTFTKANKDVYYKSFDDAGQTGSIKIMRMYMIIQRQIVTPEYYRRIQSVLIQRPAKYPLVNRTEMRYHNIPVGTTTYQALAVFSGLTPKKMVVGFMPGPNFQGTRTTSGLNFQPCQVHEIYTEKNGFKVPSNGYSNLNFGTALATGSALKPYMALKALGKQQDPPVELNISYSDFCMNGYCLFVFDYTPDMKEEKNNDNTMSPTNTSPINLNVVFDTDQTGIPEALHMVMYASFDSLLDIDRDRRVTFNWM